VIIKPKYYGPQIPSTYAVNMTAAASGSNGITVADDDDIDFGTGDFFLHWEGSLPDWTPADFLFLVRKNTDATTDGYAFFVDGSPSGRLLLILRDGGVSSTEYNSTVAAPAVDGSIAKLTCVVVREIPSAAGSVTFYVNGIQLGSPVAITAGTPFSISNALSMYVSGTSIARTASSTISCIVGNFAPAAAEVLDLCTNGIPESWKWGSQANKIVSSFANGAGANAYTSFSGASASGFSAVSNGSSDQRASTADEISIVAGKRYIVSLSLVVNSGVVGTIGVRSAITAGITQASVSTPSSGKIVLDFVASITDTVLLYTRNINQAGDFVISNASFRQAGATMALLPNSIPTSGATAWDDSSGNTGGGTLPAAGATKVTIRK